MATTELPYEIVERLREIVAKHGLESELDPILQEAQPCLDLVNIQTDFLPPIGATKIAGMPDLPSSLVWPGNDEERFTFLAQINLSELPYRPHDNFPQSGWIWFFLGSDESSLDVEHKILFFDGPITSLRRVQPPPKKEINAEYRGFISAAATFNASFSLPFRSELSQRIFDCSETAFEELYCESTRVGGHPEQYNGDYRQDAVLVRNGFKDVIYDCRKSDEQIQNEILQAKSGGLYGARERLEGMRPRIEEYRLQKPRLDACVKKCQHLFQLTSLTELEMCWWDAGCLQFFIDEDDLRARRFDRTYCGLMTC